MNVQAVFNKNCEQICFTDHEYDIMDFIHIKKIYIFHFHAQYIEIC